MQADIFGGEKNPGVVVLKSVQNPPILKYEIQPGPALLLSSQVPFTTDTRTMFKYAVPQVCYEQQAVVELLLYTRYSLVLQEVLPTQQRSTTRTAQLFVVVQCLCCSSCCQCAIGQTDSTPHTRASMLSCYHASQKIYTRVGGLQLDTNNQ